MTITKVLGQNRLERPISMAIGGIYGVVSVGNLCLGPDVEGLAAGILVAGLMLIVHGVIDIGFSPGDRRCQALLTGVLSFVGGFAAGHFDQAGFGAALSATGLSLMGASAVAWAAAPKTPLGD
jgi:uncharacterized membrane protein HdeD (DUF308 family)